MRYLSVVLCCFSTLCNQYCLHANQICYSEKFCSFLTHLNDCTLPLISNVISITTKEGRKTIYKLCKTPTSGNSEDNITLIREAAKILQQLNWQEVYTPAERNSLLSLFSLLLAGYVVYYEKFGDDYTHARNHEYLICSEIAKIKKIHKYF
jgi:hypothetical protein